MTYTINQRLIHHSGTEMVIDTFEADSYQEAVGYFTDSVREWMANDTTGTIIYHSDDEYFHDPAYFRGSGYYDDSDNLLLLDGDNVCRFEIGNYIYWLE